MKLTAVCCTYLRPECLGNLIECFLRQDYPSDLKRLVILDDAGQYGHQSGPGWKLISVPQRFRSLGEKRNACCALADFDTDGFLIADDDDIYLSHWFQVHSIALRRAQWSRPSKVIRIEFKRIEEVYTGGLYHASWALQKSVFYAIGGYGPRNNGEDYELGLRLEKYGATQFDPNTIAPPFFINNRDHDSYRTAGFTDDVAYQKLGTNRPTSSEKIPIGWSRAWDALPVVRINVNCRYETLPKNWSGIKMNVELIRTVPGLTSGGPNNGMYALQKLLRKRIDEGLDWLSIVDEASDEGTIPWFWHWEDRIAAELCILRNRPFFQGPNMLFLNSRSPRIDATECTLLDGGGCRAMFCHTQWYSDLIESQRGMDNKSPIVQCPYPIDPLPEGPASPEYDLLIYVKHDSFRRLASELEKIHRRHVTLHYGHYQREQLFKTASKSRCCVYLSDDDHGPLGLQEILLCGCPVVGVPRGAPYIRNGKTGNLLDRLPRVTGAASEDSDTRPLLEAIQIVSKMDRHEVRKIAVEQFDSQKICDRIVTALDEHRG